MKIAFIGVGVMGRGMVFNLLKKGFDVHVYTRTKSSAAGVVKEGAMWHDTIKECIQDAPAVITIVGYPKDVEQVYFGPEGILENAAKDAALIDMTTTEPKLAQRIFKEAQARGLHALDAPVSGGDSGAANGTLTIMAGGEEEIFDACKPIFEAMGRNIRYAGAAGMGQHTKCCNQIAIAGALSGVCEAIAYARKAGLDTQGMIDTIAGGAAGSWQLTNNGAKIAKGDFQPGFFIKHFIKDMGIAQAEAQARGLELPILDQVLEMYRALAQKGLEEAGTQALIKAYE